jgi:hypothetical protein
MNHLDRYLELQEDKTLVTHCPLCFNTICLDRNIEGEWVKKFGCCHLRKMIKADDSYIGKFSYGRGEFEGIVEVVNGKI